MGLVRARRTRLEGRADVRGQLRHEAVLHAQAVRDSPGRWEDGVVPVEENQRVVTQQPRQQLLLLVRVGPRPGARSRVGRRRGRGEVAVTRLLVTTTLFRPVAHPPQYPELPVP